MEWRDYWGAQSLKRAPLHMSLDNMKWMDVTDLFTTDSMGNIVNGKEIVYKVTKRIAPGALQMKLRTQGLILQQAIIIDIWVDKGDVILLPPRAVVIPILHPAHKPTGDLIG